MRAVSVCFSFSSFPLAPFSVQPGWLVRLSRPRCRPPPAPVASSGGSLRVLPSGGRDAEAGQEPLVARSRTRTEELSERNYGGFFCGRNWVCLNKTQDKKEAQQRGAAWMRCAPELPFLFCLFFFFTPFRTFLQCDRIPLPALAGAGRVNNKYRSSACSGRQLRSRGSAGDRADTAAPTRGWPCRSRSAAPCVSRGSP